ncbi:uncharacterized protein BX664DRAFT_382217 [Halteromyces radiatus]|uniref:uncharacterized protein n=1 Tax=Halteromyces radiatus TaxID=101107 RepID=UPI00221E5ACF|nr:uncharacterized protein BX664DRAFT_382217 [Halteromyces radiatus]KAI8099717.1 hypothetical protein BX664DRAFT_382217 [Halteromyces radiatus]
MTTNEFGKLYSLKSTIIPSSKNHDTMFFVKDNDTLYPSFIGTSNARLLFQTDEAHFEQKLTREQYDPMDIHLNFPNSIQQDEDNIQEETLRKLDVSTIPTIHEILATPTQKPSSTSASSSRNLSLTPSYHPPQGSQQQCQVATIPVTADASTNDLPIHKDTILKTGQLLCCKTSIWYTSRQQRDLNRYQRRFGRQQQQQQQQQQRAVQRQETRLAWREFRAVLKPDCLELYLVSPLLLHGPRLAHTIQFSYTKKPLRINTNKSIKWWQPTLSSKSSHLNSWQFQKQQHKERYHSQTSRAKLSLASMADYTIRLEYQNKTGGTTVFLLQAPTSIESQAWYMALYKQIPMVSMNFAATHTPQHNVNHQQHHNQKHNQQLTQLYSHQHISSKKSIPPFLDVIIPCLQEKDDYGDTITPTFVRVPLTSVMDQGARCVIRANDLKHCLFKMLNDAKIQKGCKYKLMAPEMMSLCWRLGHRIEWISDSASLICPQLIEKQHSLELRSMSPDQVLESPLSMEGFLLQSTNDKGQFKHKHQQSQMYALMEGHYLFLIDPSKAVLPNQQENQKRGWSLNWLSAATLMNLYPRRYGNGGQQRRQQRQHQQQDNGEKSNQHHFFQSMPGFFTKQSSSSQHGPRSSFFFHHSNKNTSNEKSGNRYGKGKVIKGTAAAVTNNRDDNGDPDSVDMDNDMELQQEATRIADMLRRAGQVGYAYAVIDLSLVDRVQPVRIKNNNNNNNNNNKEPGSSATTPPSRTGTSTPSSPSSLQHRTFSALSSSSSSNQLLKTELCKRQKRLFELVMNDNSTRLQFEATSAQAMFEWVRRLRRGITYGKECQSKGIVLSQAISSLWYRHIHKTILQSGVLYVRKNTQNTFRRYLCVLSRGRGLLLYRYNRHGIMTKRRTIRLQRQQNNNSSTRATYVYGVDHPSDLKSNDGPTAMMTLDGERSRNEGIYQSAFVVWQRYSLSKNHWIMQIKEHISLLKLGHRLGRKGHSFVFLASNMEEKEAWLWALQQELSS